MWALETVFYKYWSLVPLGYNATRCFVTKKKNWGNVKNDYVVYCESLLKAKILYFMVANTKSREQIKS